MALAASGGRQASAGPGDGRPAAGAELLRVVPELAVGPDVVLGVVSGVVPRRWTVVATPAPGSCVNGSRSLAGGAAGGAVSPVAHPGKCAAAGPGKLAAGAVPTVPATCRATSGGTDPPRRGPGTASGDPAGWRPASLGLPRSGPTSVLDDSAESRPAFPGPSSPSTEA